MLHRHTYVGAGSKPPDQPVEIHGNFLLQTSMHGEDIPPHQPFVVLPPRRTFCSGYLSYLFQQMIRIYGRKPAQSNLLSSAGLRMLTEMGKTLVFLFKG